MSILNKDQEILNEGRKALDGIEAAPLLDQIPAKLAKKLDEMKVGERVASMWSLGNSNRTEWLARQQEYLQDWDEFLESSADKPFEMASSLHLPMPLIVAKTLHARFLQALLGIDPPFNVKPRREDGVDRQALVQDTMNYALKDWCNYYNGCQDPVDLWLWDWITIGSSVMKLRWECEYERFVDVKPVQVQGPPKLVRDPQGNQMVVPTFQMEDQEVDVTKVVFDGPVFQDVRHEDLLIIGGSGDPQLADAVLHHDQMTMSQVLTLVDRKVFRKDEAMEVLEGGPDYQMGPQGSEIKQQRLSNEGKASLDTDADLDRYSIIEAYLKLDVDGSGINSNVVVWVHPKTRKLLRATYLRRINKSGKRPFFKIDFHKRPNREFGVGIIEMIHPLSVELDAMHNMRIDFGLISNLPFGFYKSTSSINPQTLQLAPGALIPVDSPDDVYFPNLGNRTAFGFQEEQGLMGLIERLTTINEMNMGAMSGVQGPTRTATGARALMGESNSNLDVYLRRLNQGWKQALDFLLHMLQQRVPKGLAFRVTGEAGDDYFAQVRGAEDIAGDFDFEISPNSANSNRSIMEQTAQEVVQITASPLDIQLGIITPQQRYEALKDYLKARGIKQFGRYLKQPPQMMTALTPEEEANRILNGIPVPVTPEQDHGGFLAYFQHIHDSDELLGQFNEQQTMALGKQAALHKQMMDALKQMAAQKANSNQMQVNAQQGSAPGLNPFAGASISQPNPPGVE